MSGSALPLLPWTRSQRLYPRARAWRSEEQFAHNDQIEKVDRSVRVKVGVCVVAQKHTGKFAEVEKVHHAVVVRVGIAGVALAVQNA